MRATGAVEVRVAIGPDTSEIYSPQVTVCGWNLVGELGQDEEAGTVGLTVHGGLHIEASSSSMLVGGIRMATAQGDIIDV